MGGGAFGGAQQTVPITGTPTTDMPPVVCEKDDDQLISGSPLAKGGIFGAANKAEDTRKCHNYGEVGHIARNCRKSRDPSFHHPEPRFQCYDRSVFGVSPNTEFKFKKMDMASPHINIMLRATRPCRWNARMTSAMAVGGGQQRPTAI